MVTEVRELRKLVETLSTEIDVKDLPEYAGQWVARLTECGVTKPLARRLVAGAARRLDSSDQDGGKDAFGECMRAEMNGMVHTTGGIAEKGKRGARVIALIGPTGVGKTTSIAKLASGLALNEKRRVAFVTADTYRIAATEQLRVYADLIHVPMDVVYGADDLKDAIERHLQRDYVFIDTAGSSQFNEEQMVELCDYIKTAQCDEVHLLLSATTDLHEMGEIVERFATVSPTCVLFTKIDETTRQGILLNTLAQTELPVSYLSMGQSVPEDIEMATTESVTAWVLGETEKSTDGPGGKTSPDG
jgi:flagellar biosynthesis protein FlhF